MSEPYEFDLERAISTWRKSLSTSRALTPRDLDELERHLRDEITASAQSDEDAFRAAAAHIGQYPDIESEYSKVYWGKLRQSGATRAEIGARLLLLGRDLKSAWRQAVRNPGYAMLNVLGLAVGMAGFLVILMFIRFETSFDQHHSRADRIFRVVTERTAGGVTSNTIDTPLPLASRLESTLPQVEYAARFGRLWAGVFSHDGRQFHESDVFFADPHIFRIFDFDLVAGTLDGALSRDGEIILTRSTARKYFGNDDPIGKTLTFTFEGSQEFTVVAVVEDIPSTSHFKFDFLVPTPSFLRDDFDWTFDNAPTYLLAGEAATASVLDQSLVDLVSALGPETTGPSVSFAVQPLQSIHLGSHLKGELGENGSQDLLVLLGGIGVLLLLIACINFVNLATARSVRRAREVGVRKVMGAFRIQLIRQFMGEAVMLSMCAALLSLGIVWLILPVFNAMMGADMSMDASQFWFVGAAVVTIGIFIGLASGSYPAFTLSSFQPVHVLKSRFSGSTRGVALRKGLVIAQFSIGIFFLIGLLVMRDQMQFLQSRDLGYDTEQIIFLRSPQRTTPTPYDAFKSELSAVPGVVSVAGSGDIPGLALPSANFSVGRPGSAVGDRFATNYYFTHPDFLETLGLEWVTEPLPYGLTDSTRVFIVNESAAARLRAEGIEMGDDLGIYFNDNPDPFVSQPVVGVLRNFNYESLHSQIEPLVITLAQRSHTWTWMALRIDPSNLPRTMQGIEATWQKLAPEWPLDLRFLDEQFGSLYAKEKQRNLVLSVFTGLAMFIACLGLFGLAVFSTEQRTKEIGVRKVMGAHTAGLVALLSKEFVQLIAVAFLLAVPLGWLATERWLSTFAYRVEPGIGAFVWAGGSVLALTLLSVGWQAMRAANANPVDSLRYE